MGVEAVDPDRHGLALGLPVDVVERLNDIGPRVNLIGRRHGVLQIEENVIHGAVGGLLDHRRIGAGNGELGALKSLFFKGIEGVAHVGFPLGLVLRPEWTGWPRGDTFAWVAMPAGGWGAGLNGKGRTTRRGRSGMPMHTVAAVQRVVRKTIVYDRKLVFRNGALARGLRRGLAWFPAGAVNPCRESGASHWLTSKTPRLYRVGM